MPVIREQTLCWECKNACGGCSWSKNFEPVAGWNALPTTLKSCSGRIEQSYLVRSCPKYVEG